MAALSSRSMSDLAAAAAALGIPEDLTSRSAAARAAANGTDTDSVIAAWAGGGSVATQAPAPETAAPVVEESPPADPAPPVDAPAAPVEAPVAAPVAVAEPEPIAVMVETVDPIEPVPLQQRIRVASRVGAGVGLVSALMIALFSSSWLLARSGAVEEGDGFTTVVEVISGWIIVGSALVGIVAGVAIAAISRTVTSMADRGMRLVSSPTVTAVTGAIAGGVVGALLGSIIVGTGTPSELDPAIQVVPVFAGLLWLLAGWVAGGWAIGALVQSIGVPAGVHDHEYEETDVVRKRLVSGFAIPAIAAVSIATFVIPLAWIFIQFPGFAPLLAVVVAVGILAFASLSASRPGMRISAGEFAAAAAGVGVVLLILVSVLLVQGVGHGEEGHEADESATEDHGEPAGGEADAILLFI